MEIGTVNDINYRELLKTCYISGKAMPLNDTDYTKEKVKETLIRYIEALGNYGKTINDEAEDLQSIRNILWIIKKDEVVEKGLYRWNRTCEYDIAVVATPAAMAVVMGEYELAMQLICIDSRELYNGLIDELYQEGEDAFIGGGSYTIRDAWMVSDEMEKQSVLDFFTEHIWDRKYCRDDEELMEEFVFRTDGRTGIEQRMRPFGVLKMMCERTRCINNNIFTQVIQYALRTRLDMEYEVFWDRIFVTFRSRAEREIIIQTVHRYFNQLCSLKYIPGKYEERVIKVVEKYARYEGKLVFEGDIREYLFSRIKDKQYTNGKMKKYLCKYLGVTRGFEGVSDSDWMEIMNYLPRIFGC